jgi:hypothetical protein
MSLQSSANDALAPRKLGLSTARHFSASNARIAAIPFDSSLTALLSTIVEPRSSRIVPVHPSSEEMGAKNEWRLFFVGSKDCGKRIFSRPRPAKNFRSNWPRIPLR